MDAALGIEAVAGVLGLVYVVVGRLRRRLSWVVAGLCLVVCPLIALRYLGLAGTATVLAVLALAPVVAALTRRRTTG